MRFHLPHKIRHSSYTPGSRNRAILARKFLSRNAPAPFAFRRGYGMTTLKRGRRSARNPDGACFCTHCGAHWMRHSFRKNVCPPRVTTDKIIRLRGKRFETAGRGKTLGGWESIDLASAYPQNIRSGSYEISTPRAPCSHCVCWLLWQAICCLCAAKVRA